MKYSVVTWKSTHTISSITTMADDLYAGLTLPTRTKRAASSRTDATDRSASIASAAATDAASEQEQARAAKRQKAADLDLPATIAKLQGYMVRSSLRLCIALSIETLAHALSYVLLALDSLTHAHTCSSLTRSSQKRARSLRSSWPLP